MTVRRLAIVAASCALLPVPALAHPGHEVGGFVAGIAHPLTGMDHLAAMLLIGLWAGVAGGRALWTLPAAFLTAMLAGFGYGALSHGGGSGVEMLVILSVLALGGVVALTLHPPLALSATLAALFGFAHGMTHGLEAPGGMAALGFAGGFLATTALLHVAGIGMARHVSVRWVQGIGIAGAALGLLLAGTA